jgi:hypothetical protein
MDLIKGLEVSAFYKMLSNRDLIASFFAKATEETTKKGHTMCDLFRVAEKEGFSVPRLYLAQSPD